MKRTLICLMLLCSVYCVRAQGLRADMQTLMDACLSMRSSIGVGDVDGLRNANKIFRSVKTAEFTGLKPVLPEKFGSLNDHFIFEPEFIDSLIVLGKGGVYRYADRYATRGNSTRGTGSKGVHLKNIVLKSESSSVFNMTGNGHMELVFVTEPRGLISVTIYDRKHKMFYKEQEKEREGDVCRVHTFDLPQDGNAELEVTIRNTTGYDVSCIVMCN